MRSTIPKLTSNRTAKKMQRIGNRIRREVSKQKGTFSNHTVKRFANWWMSTPDKWR